MSPGSRKLSSPSCMRITSELSFAALSTSDTSAGHNTFPFTPSQSKSRPCISCTMRIRRVRASASSARNAGVCSSPPNPQFVHLKIRDHAVQPVQMIVMRVRQRHYVQLLNSARPQIRRHHFLAHIWPCAVAARSLLLLPARRRPPPSCVHPGKPQKLNRPAPRPARSPRAFREPVPARRDATPPESPAQPQPASQSIPQDARPATNAGASPGRAVVRRSREPPPPARINPAKNAITSHTGGPGIRYVSRGQRANHSTVEINNPMQKLSAFASSSPSTRPNQRHPQRHKSQRHDDCGQQYRRNIAHRPRQAHAMKILRQ